MATDDELDTAYSAGRKAFFDSVQYVKNPYRDDDPADAWAEGWLEAEGDESYYETEEIYGN